MATRLNEAAAHVTDCALRLYLGVRVSASAGAAQRHTVAKSNSANVQFRRVVSRAQSLQKDLQRVSVFNLVFP